MTIAICTPTRDTIHAGTVYDLMNQVTKESTFFATALGTFLPQQRTSLVRGAIKSGASHILFIDSDMRFPLDTIESLLAAKKGIIGANYRHRQSPEKWTSGITSKGAQGMEKVEVIGFGVSLIRVEIFALIPEPWFATPYDGVDFVSDDVFFCAKARKMGIDIWADHDLSQDVSHIGLKEYSING
jgi:hypothetical protein